MGHVYVRSRGGINSEKEKSVCREGAGSRRKRREPSSTTSLHGKIGTPSPRGGQTKWFVLVSERKKVAGAVPRIRQRRGGGGTENRITGDWQRKKKSVSNMKRSKRYKNGDEQTKREKERMTPRSVPKRHACRGRTNNQREKKKIYRNRPHAHHARIRGRSCKGGPTLKREKRRSHGRRKGIAYRDT